jgi:hypothetical protein
MNAVPPTIAGSDNLKTLSVETLKTDNLNAETVNAETVNATNSVSNRLNVNLSGSINNFIAYSGTGSIIKGNDTTGQVNFVVITTDINQFRLFYNTPYSTPPIVILTQVGTYISTTVELGNSALVYIPIQVSVTSNTDYFTITLPFGISSITLLPGNITVNYIVIGTI